MDQMNPPSRAEIQNAEHEHDLSIALVIAAIASSLVMFFINSLDGSEELYKAVQVVNIFTGGLDIGAIMAYFGSKLALDDISERSRDYIKTLKQ